MGTRTTEHQGTELSLTNADIANKLDDVANLLEQQQANRYRVQAWRSGAATIRRQSHPVTELLEKEGIEGLDKLPGIGRALASAVQELAETGHLATLERLRGESDPVALLATVPGLGATLANRIHNDLQIDTLEQLEIAAHDGRLEHLAGMGAKRVKAIADVLATRLRRHTHSAASVPPVIDLLHVDREYRERADAGTLPTIAPRRFNPGGRHWLPVLHTTHGGRHYTALFSNTATAHRLGRTHDWVVIYLDGDDGEQRCTVVTETSGPLADRRVVRGRESECAEFYGLHDA